MRNLFIVSLIFVSLIVLTCYACEAPANQKNDSGYFDLSQTIKEQIELLGGGKWKSEKVIIVNNAADQIPQSLDSAGLKGELVIFQAFDPGKPQFKNAFEITESEGVITYKKKESESQSLQWVKVEDQGNVLRITAEIIEETSIYTNEKKMDIQLELGVLKSYALYGYQKMLFRDTTFFEMKATVQ